MKIEQKQVESFMLKAGQECREKPAIPDNKVCAFHLTLIKEEWNELSIALMKDDLVEVADAIGDLLVVVLATAVACGIDTQPVWDEIHRSNMTKFIDGYKREDGKWMKGPSFQPPNLKPIIEEQLGHQL